jgi:hypothetical protein
LFGGGGFFSPACKRFREHAIDLLGDIDGKVVLDVGCDTGRNFPFLVRRVGAEGRIIRVECSLGMLDVGRARNEQAEKNGEPVRLLVPRGLVSALGVLPLPKGAAVGCRSYFWSGVGSVRALKNSGHRMLDAVFRRSAVRDAHSHRFRYTLATEMLTHGATYEDVAAVLGNSPAIVRKVHGETAWCKSAARG